VFSQSPVNLGALLILGIASLALLGLRRISAESRRYWQVGLVTTTVIALVVGYGFRSSIIGLLNGANDLEYRLGIWRNLSVFIRLHNLEGWGWSGSWPQNLPPFIAVDPPAGHLYSALNAYFDVWFQLGLVGLFAFLVFAALAIGRSWILAAQQRSRVYVWPALVLVALLATSLAESFVLVDLGWLTLVICAVKAAQKLSWRGALPD
jgi:O-antigen ligase